MLYGRQGASPAAPIFRERQHVGGDSARTTVGSAAGACARLELGHVMTGLSLPPPGKDSAMAEGCLGIRAMDVLKAEQHHTLARAFETLEEAHDPVAPKFLKPLRVELGERVVRKLAAEETVRRQLSAPSGEGVTEPEARVTNGRAYRGKPTIEDLLARLVAAGCNHEHRVTRL